MKKLRLLLMLFIQLCGIAVYAQQTTVTGVVSNKETGQPLEGITVLVNNNAAGVVTKTDGSFSVNADAASGTLTFKHVGYVQQTIKIDGRKNIFVALSPTDNSLSDVVVIGYGTQKKADLTGSVASVSMSDVDKTPVTGTEQLLEGKVSGVQVTQVNAQPGSVFSVRIRGTNSINSSSEPLYVVDGFAGADISNINPDDIASMDVLKDASATAIYGSRGANGVVIITTKIGRSGNNVISFDAYYGVQRIRKKMDMMNAPQFAAYLDSVYSKNGNALPYTTGFIDSLGAGTDWQDALFRAAPTANYALSISGGDATTRHFLSFTYYGQNGIILNSGYKRGGIRYNLNKNLSSKLRIGLNTSVTYGNQRRSNVNANGGTSGAIVGDALIMSPLVPVDSADGAYSFSNAPTTLVREVGNPVAAAILNTDRLSSIVIFGNFYFEYDILKGLKFKSSIGANYRDTIENQFIPTTTYLGSLTDGLISKTTTSDYNWLNENTLSFDRTFNNIHVVNAVVGFTLQDFKYSKSNSSTEGLQTNNLGSNNIAVGQSVMVPTSNIMENTLASYFGRINYRLMDKYLFTFTMRADGSSRFGADNKWGYFPSGAFAWRISKEGFMKNATAVSDLKLRTSYGVTGNQEIGSYNSLAQYTANNYTAGAANSGATNLQVGFSPANIPNPNLKWESTSSFDAGLDLGVLNDAIYLTADYYYKKTFHLLLQASVPSSSGYTKLLENVGDVENHGFEFVVNTTNIKSKNIKWNTSFNMGFNRNKILDLGGQNDVPIGNVSSSLYPGAGKFFSSVLQVGQPIGTFYGYEFGGIWQSLDQIKESGTKQAVKPGDPIYKDLNGDSVLTAADQTIIGHASPKFIYGFTSNLTVGRFNLFILIQGQYGDNILNENLLQTVNGYNNTNKLAYVGTQSWNGPGTSNTLPAVNSVYRIGLGVTSDLIEDGSYARLKTVTLSYDVPLPKLSKGIFKSANVYVTAQNLLTLTKYSGYDPEVNSYGLDGTSLNTDYNSYPNVKTFLIGVKFGF